MITNLAPICLFTYNRPIETLQTVVALKKNFLAPNSEIFIFSDGKKNNDGSKKVDEVRHYIQNITGFKSITIYKSPINQGLANSIISGVSQIITQYGKVIVLEDDLITSPNFLNFMNQALNFYDANKQIHSISGYTYDLPYLNKYHKDYYLGYRASSWGWGTWKDRWEEIDWEVKQYDNFKKNPLQQLKFMRGGSDMPRMLKNQITGKIDSWAIRWCFNQFLMNQVTVFPSTSKIQNIGYGENATHTKKTNRFHTILDTSEQKVFKFDYNPVLNNNLLREFQSKFSYWSRFKDKFI